VPIDHVNIPVSNLDASRMFYEAALAPFGFRVVYESISSLGFGTGDGGDDDEPLAVRLGDPTNRSTHVVFTASDVETVQAFHRAAIKNGGRDNGAPGERPYGGYYYAAFALDPDGHNIEAVLHRTGD
jgi:catechol 2,3-dioxygenase-like lactoylglutathione lyase family enzyme